jgi:hypothetical protein
MENKPDRIADLLDEAAKEIAWLDTALERALNELINEGRYELVHAIRCTR